jgi:hypothetical protein
MRIGGRGCRGGAGVVWTVDNTIPRYILLLCDFALINCYVMESLKSSSP